MDADIVQSSIRPYCTPGLLQVHQTRAFDVTDNDMRITVDPRQVLQHLQRRWRQVDRLRAGLTRRLIPTAFLTDSERIPKAADICFKISQLGKFECR